MKVNLIIGDEEIREALRAWLETHGVPNVVVETLVIDGDTTHSGWVKLKAVRLKVDYEADSLTTHEARPPAVVPVADAEPPKYKPQPHDKTGWSP